MQATQAGHADASIFPGRSANAHAEPLTVHRANATLATLNMHRAFDLSAR
jgi:hypothetical protein